MSKPDLDHEGREIVAWYWITRNRIGGDLSTLVVVWTVEPRRHRLDDGDVIWMAHDETTARWSFTLDEVWWAGTLPETDVECVRVPGVRGHSLVKPRNKTKAARVGGA